MLVLGIVIAIARRLFSTGKDVQARNADIDWILIIGFANCGYHRILCTDPQEEILKEI